MSAPEWETSKENVAPLSTGRNVDTLNKALTMDPEVIESTRKIHEAAIRDAANGIGPFSNDPLAVWDTYYKWALETFPSGSELIISILEGACRRYGKTPRYKDDRRFVRLWIRYADLRSDKLDVFAYMRKNHIGEHVALFYEAWATTLELAKDYDKAEQTYKLGIKLGAQPQERLSQRMREYYNRMAARARRAEKKARDDEKKKQDAQRAKGASSARAQSTLADSILSRTETAHSSATHNNENEMPSANIRPALGRITERQAETGRRPMTAISKKKPLVFGERARVEHSAPGPSSLVRNPQNEKIEIYADPDPAAVSPSNEYEKIVKEQDHFPFAPLAKAHEVSKENDGKLPSKWAGQTLPQNPTVQNRVRRGARVAGSPIQIYQENDDTDVAEERASQAGASKAGPSDRVVEDRPSSPVPARKSAVPVNPTSPTINTKIAMQEVDDLFNSSLPMERERQKVIAESLSAQKRTVREEQPRQIPSIEIFRDVDDEDKENVHRAGSVRRGSNGPTGNPRLEERVLQSIPALEGPYVRRVVDDDEYMNTNEQETQAQNTTNVAQDETTPLTQKPEEHAGQSSVENLEGTSQAEREFMPPGADHAENRGDSDDSAENELIEFLAKWCYQEPGYHLLDGEDPEVEREGYFEFYPRGKEVAIFNVDMYLWQGYGNHSKVVAVEDLDNVLGLRDHVEMDDDSNDLLTLKVYQTSEPWEFYVYKMLHARIGAPLLTVPTALAYYEGSPAGYLVLDRLCPVTLKEIITFPQSYPLTEGLAMYFTVDLLKTLEVLHGTGIIHSDVTLDNVLFRSDPSKGLVEDRYTASSPGSWESKGVLLVDFNHAIDTRRAVPNGNIEDVVRHATKHGNEYLDPDYRNPNASSWGFNIDCHCAAVCASKMLKLHSLKAKGSGVGLKSETIWETFFQAVQRLSANSKAAETIDTVRRCREMMEGALFEYRGLKTELMELSTAAEMKEAEEALGI